MTALASTGKRHGILLVLLMLVSGLAAASGSAAMGAEDTDSSMRDMMREMMRGQVPPPGMTPESLPEPDSDGARLMVRYCEQCHDLPSPKYKTAQEWPAVFARMNARMRMMSGGSGMGGGGMMGMHLSAPDTGEAKALLNYLRSHGMRAAKSDELLRGAQGDRREFEAACARCHVLPSPAQHVPNEWPAVVGRMVGNMQAMGKTVPAPSELQRIVRFLQQSAVSSSPPIERTL